jgi:hypothetical protein
VEKVLEFDGRMTNLEEIESQLRRLAPPGVLPCNLDVVLFKQAIQCPDSAFTVYRQTKSVGPAFLTADDPADIETRLFVDELKKTEPLGGSPGQEGILQLAHLRQEQTDQEENARPDRVRGIQDSDRAGQHLVDKKAEG